MAKNLEQLQEQAALAQELGDFDAELEARESIASFGATPQAPAISQFQPVPTAQPSEAPFASSVKRGLERSGAGILQRGAEALKSVGIDTDEFLSDLAVSENIQRQQARPTQEESPITSFAGEAVGGAIALPIPAARLPGLAVSGGVTGGLEFTEGDAVDVGVNVLTGAILSPLFDVIGRKGAELIKSAGQTALKKLGITKEVDNIFTPDGDVLPEVSDILEEQGVAIEDLSKQVIDEVQAQPEGADVAQALRKAEAEELGVTSLTKADITQRFDDQSAEFTLARQRGSAEANQIRQLKAEQNQQIINAGQDIVSDIGEEGKLQAGQVIQDALRSSKENRRQAINNLYDIAEKEAGVTIPVSQEGVAETFFEQDFIFGLDPNVGGTLQAVKKQLEAFSVIPPELIKSSQDLKRIRPLTIGSANELRKNINALIGTNPQAQAAFIPIREAIDEAIDTIAIEDTLGQSAKQAFNSARKARTEFGRRFEAKDIVQDIVSLKPGTQTDRIPPSVVFNKIINSEKRLENTQTIKTALLESGEEGVKAWNDYRATAMAELLGKGLTTGKTAAGDFSFSGANFNKAIKNIGDDTLSAMFSKEEMAVINQLGRVSRDLTVLQDGVFTPSGAQVENSLSRLANLGLFKATPLVREVIREGGEQVKKGQRAKALSEVISPDIDVNSAKELGEMSNAAVNIFRLLGLSSTTTAKDRRTQSKRGER